jgi:hypothetical protein
MPTNFITHFALLNGINLKSFKLLSGFIIGPLGEGLILSFGLRLHEIIKKAINITEISRRIFKFVYRSVFVIFSLK